MRAACGEYHQQVQSLIPRHVIPLFCRSEQAPGGVPTMDVNDNACCLSARVIQSLSRASSLLQGFRTAVNVYTGMSPSVPFMCALFVSTPPKVTSPRLT